MKLPNAEKAIVSREKIADYLLHAAHPDNGGKADFFERLGFRRDEWAILAAAFKALANQNEALKAAETPHGTKYIITGRIEAPGGKAAQVQSIWIMDKGQDAARLVTAYPRKV